MTAHETEIRRHTNGAIDIDHYVRQCHRQRSLAAHEAIGRSLAMVKILAGKLLIGKRNPGAGKTPLSPRDTAAAPVREAALRRAA